MAKYKYVEFDAMEFKVLVNAELVAYVLPIENSPVENADERLKTSIVFATGVYALVNDPPRKVIKKLQS